MSDMDVVFNCASWLQRLGVLSKSQADTIDSIQQLASFIRDGVLLCHLANRLKSDVINPRDFSQKPKNSQFLCKKNIDVFLHVAKNVFGLKDKDLFTQKELFQLTNFAKVLFTLSKLSELEISKKQGFEPFAIEVETVYVIVESQIEDDIYSTSSTYDTKLVDIDDSEEIYEIFINKKTLPQSSTESQSEKCVKELITSEKNYLDLLHSIKFDYQDALQNYLTNRESEEIFHDIEPILDLHKKFYQDLMDCRYIGFKLADCFISYKMQMTVYADYCAHLPTASSEVALLSKSNQQAFNLIESISLKVKIKLHDILIVPFQRFFKYPLLLKELRKHASNEGNVALAERWKVALDCVEDLALYINEYTRGKEALQEMDAILQTIQDGLPMKANAKLSDYGRRLFDGEFNYRLSTNKTSELKTVFLFEKMIIICKQKRNNKLIYVDFIVLNGAKISIESINREKQLCISQNGKIHIFTSPKDYFLYQFEELISLALVNIFPPGSSLNGFDFVLSNFNKPTACSVCNNLLKGALSQGYLCRKTRKTVHKDCILSATNIEETAISTSIPTSNYMNNLDTYTWYAGDMSNDEAYKIIAKCPDGTFLVRNADTSFTIVLKYQSVRKLKVQRNKTLFGLGSLNFNTIVELVQYFQTNSLTEKFSLINTTLRYPYREVS